jgi:hypothetical protein
MRFQFQELEDLEVALVGDYRVGGTGRDSRRLPAPSCFCWRNLLRGTEEQADTVRSVRDDPCERGGRLFPAGFQRDPLTAKMIHRSVEVCNGKTDAEQSLGSTTNKA